MIETVNVIRKMKKIFIFLPLTSFYNELFISKHRVPIRQFQICRGLI